MSRLISLVALKDARARIALGGALALALPPLLLGPWLPFVDLVAFVGLNSYPAKLSAGPLHFAVFQFTYIVHYALSRFLVDLGVRPAGQIMVFYLLQAGIFFTVLQVMLRRLLPHAWLASLAGAFGALAFWDGHFMTGGPLPFSLAAGALAVATVMSFQEIDEPRNTARVVVPLLAFLSMMCHPFAFPFAAILAGLRFWFVPRCKAHSLLLLAGLAVFAWVIRNDSVESVEAPHLTMLFTLSPDQMLKRLGELFTWDADVADTLFGWDLVWLRGYLTLVGVIHFMGFVAAPIVLVRVKEPRALRLLAAMNTLVALMFFLAADNVVVTSWPQRILAFYRVFAFASGIILPWHLLRHWKPEIAEFKARRALWLAPAAALVLVAALQVPVLRLSRNLAYNYVGLREGLVKAGASNAFVVVNGVDEIRPFYLRALPFLLFSDPELVRRNIILFTEWHLQPRHPTRLAEDWFDLGRQRFAAVFSSRNGIVNLEFARQPDNVEPVVKGTNVSSYGATHFIAEGRFLRGRQLMDTGAIRDAIPHFEAAVRLLPDQPEYLNNLAVAFLRTGRFKEAIPNLRRAVERKPTLPEANANLGTALLYGGQPAESIVAFQAALKLRPDIAEWHHELGLALLQTGRKDEAASQFEAAVALDPSHSEARTELSRLRAR